MSLSPAASSQPIENKAQLVRHHEQGAKTKDNLLIGTEHEKFVLDAKTHALAPYEGNHGIRALLQGMLRFGFQPVMEGNHIIGLSRGRENVSLEPAGQLELSGAPLKNLHEMSMELERHLSEVKMAGAELGLKFMAIGYHPTLTVDDAPWMPKGRYAIMKDYMPKVGKRGLEMMLLTCTTQANLDYTSEADMVRKMRVALALQPVVSALFASSPFQKGNLAGRLTNRCAVWLDVDPARSGTLPFAFDEGFGYERYVDYALDVPMYFVYRNGTYINCAGQSFRAFMDGRLPALPGEKPTMGDWENHLTTLFPDVRMKTYLEMRGADVGTRPDMIKALPALWTGLLYDDTALNNAEAMVREWHIAEIEEMRREITRLGMSSVVANRNVFSLAKQTVTLALQGLRRRCVRAPDGPDETRYLEPLLTLVDIEQTEAERLMSLFNGPWDEDISKIYEGLCL